MRNSVLLGAILCFIAAVSWGAMFPVAHAAFKYIDPFYFTIIRYGSVTIILVAILLWKEGKQAFRFEGKGLHLWFFGTMAFTVYNLLHFLGRRFIRGARCDGGIHYGVTNADDFHCDCMDDF